MSQNTPSSCFALPDLASPEAHSIKGQDNFFQRLLQEDYNNNSRNAEEKKIINNDDEKVILVKENCSTNEQRSEFSADFCTSEFSDGECGEPLMTQHLMIDFTPVQGLDDNCELQKKCADFWDFISKQAQLQKLLVRPMVEDKVDVKAESAASNTTQSTEEPPPFTPGLHWLEKENIWQPPVFVVKPELKYCDDTGEEDSRCGDEGAKKETTSEPLSGSTVIVDQITMEAMSTEKKRSEPGVVSLCKQLDDWDIRNPKSMDPPGPVPTLIKAVMERNRD